MDGVGRQIQRNLDKRWLGLSHSVRGSGWPATNSGTRILANEERRKVLEEFRNQVAQTEDLDEEGRILLSSLDKEIHDLLESSEDVDTPDTVLEQLQESIEHFEDTHPSLTMTLSQMLTVLSNAGI